MPSSNFELNFTCVEPNANKQKRLFMLICIRISTCKVRRLKEALVNQWFKNSLNFNQFIRATRSRYQVVYPTTVLTNEKVYVFFSFYNHRCLKYHGKGPWWCQPWGNRCKCDSPFVWRAFSQIWSCSSSSCRDHALQVFWAFYAKLSCWFPIRICFPWVRFVCGCKWCACPRIVVYWKCIVFKMCAFSGSGLVFF